MRGTAVDNISAFRPPGNRYAEPSRAFVRITVPVVDENVLELMSIVSAISLRG